MYSLVKLIDGYKLDHRRQYPKNTEFIQSNWTPRGSRILGQDEVVFFGLQYFLEKYLTEEYYKDWNRFQLCEDYKLRVDGYLGPNQIGSEHIKELRKLGHIPLRFCALPEGTRVPLRIPMFTIENTHKDFFWLVNYFETLLSNILWLPCTSATTAYRYRKLLDYYSLITGSPKEFVDWQGHDFSFRGMPGIEAAALSGAAHLLSFTGTDTLPAIDFVEKYYGNCVAGSVAATEHSVMSAGGQEDEIETFNRLLGLYPEGIVSIVSDTWDLWNVIGNILPFLKERILARNGKLVIRPDSGDPVKIICGDTLGSGLAFKGVVEALWDVFGGTYTSTGHKLLDSHIGVIYGDSITYDRCQQICEQLEAKGFSSGNMVFGIGSYTYQYVTRDTYGFAMKATWAKINGIEYNLFKKPITDSGEKFSAKGRLAVKQEDGKLVLVENATAEDEKESLLVPVWENGKFLKTYTFKEIKERLHGNNKD